MDNMQLLSSTISMGHKTMLNVNYESTDTTADVAKPAWNMLPLCWAVRRAIEKSERISNIA